MEKLIEIDHQIFYYLNVKWTNFVFDAVMPVVTDLHQSTVFLLIAGLLITTWIYISRWRALACIGTLVMVIAISDALSHRIIKPTIKRPRPENSVADTRVLTNPHSGYSFPSNHATNNFAGAVTIGYFFPQVRTMLLTIATVVAYSRVYVGVHYPLDVFAGAILGTLLAYIAGWVVNGLTELKHRIFRFRDMKLTEQRYSHAYYKNNLAEDRLRPCSKLLKAFRKKKKSKAKKPTTRKNRPGF